jgi:L-Ala-D/L-Glu epimerase
MKHDRRNFIKKSSLLIGSAIAAANPVISRTFGTTKMSKKIKLTYRPYTLELKHVFTLATSSRTTTPVVLTEIEYEGITGYGEASLPPYLGESHESVMNFLSKVDLTRYSNIFELEDILSDIDSVAPGNNAAKASVDIALHDVVGKLMGQPWYKIWGFDASKTPATSFTIGIDTPDIVRQKTREADEYKVLKVKLGRETDKEMVETIRSVTNKPITADVNQGWKDKHHALEMLHWLSERNVEFVEQPMPKEQIDDNAWLTENSPIPIIGDEAVQRLPDVSKAYGIYSGINIKLMKCTGMREAHKMLTLAKALGMKPMIGCMVETSCAISAASHITPMVEWADLDGALLISNDIFKGTEIINGKITISGHPGIGAVKVG